MVSGTGTGAEAASGLGPSPRDGAAAGVCYVDTKSLDGETNLKMRHALACTATTVRGAGDMAAVRGRWRVSPIYPISHIPHKPFILPTHTPRISSPIHLISLLTHITRTPNAPPRRTSSVPPISSIEMEHPNNVIDAFTGAATIRGEVGGCAECTFI